MKTYYQPIVKLTQSAVDAGALNVPVGAKILVVDGTGNLLGQAYEKTATSVIAAGGLKNNFAATLAPTTANDSTQGYAVGSRWIDTTNNESYVCTKAVNPASWSQTTVGNISEVANLQATLDAKVDKVTGKSLSTNDYTTAEQTKLSGIAAGATVNATDAQLRDRTTHTGSQAQSTITGLVTDLAAKQATLVSGTNIRTIDGQSLVGSGNLAPTILIVTAPVAIRLTGAVGAGVNYQTKITVGESGGSSGANFNLNATAVAFPASKNGTCSFLFWDAIGAVPFWVEKVTGTTPNRVAHIWILPNIDLSSGTQTVFLTTEAADLIRSNGNSVFTLFDDFDGASLDATKWDTSVMTGDTYASSVLSFGGGNVARRLLTLNAITDGFEIMSLLRASDTNASTSNFGFVETNAVSTTFNYRNVWDSASAVMVGTTANALATNINNGVGVRQVMRIARAGGAGRFSSENPVNTFSAASGVSTAQTKSTVYNTYDNSTEIDWVAIKKFVATEPAFSSAVQ